MEFRMLIMPLSGAVIGYFTNWLAVKMLFRPYKPVKLGKWVLPFTPGLIPKEKGRIARKMGETVGGHLLTAELLTERLLSEEVQKTIEAFLEPFFQSLQREDFTVREAVRLLFKEDTEPFLAAVCSLLESRLREAVCSEAFSDAVLEKAEQILDRLYEKKLSELPLAACRQAVWEFVSVEAVGWRESGQLAQALQKSIWTLLTNMQESEQRLEDILRAEEIRAAKDYIALRTPKTALKLLELCESPEVEEKLKAKLKKVIMSVTGSFVGFFVDTDSIYEKAVAGLTRYFETPENQGEIDEAVEQIVDKLLTVTLGEFAKAAANEARESGINRMAGRLAQFLLEEETLKKIVDKAAAMEKDGEETLGGLLGRIVPGYREKGRELLRAALSAFILEQGKWLELFVSEGAGRLLSCRISAIGAAVGPQASENMRRAFLCKAEQAIKQCAPQIAKALSVGELVEEQVQSFDMEYTERLVFSVAKKELQAITIIGGVLGFVIGLLPLVLNMIS